MKNMDEVLTPGLNEPRKHKTPMRGSSKVESHKQGNRIVNASFERGQLSFSFLHEKTAIEDNLGIADHRLDLRLHGRYFLISAVRI